MGSYLCCIPQDPRVLTLTKHLIQIRFIHPHTIATQHLCRQRRTLLLTHRWQLGTVADQQQPTILSLIHELHQVV